MAAIKLHVKDRMVLLFILNATSGNKMKFQEYMTKKDLVSKISLSENDMKRYGIQDDGEGHIKWDFEKDKEEPLEIEIDENKSEFLRKMIDSISDGEYSEDVWEVAQKVYDQC